MSTALLGSRARRAATASLVAVLALTAAGCAGVTGEATSPKVSTVGVSGAEKKDALADDSDASAKDKAAEEPSLPPGDPGLDAPSVPAPKPGEADEHDHGPARRTVPVEAMLTADTVRMMLRGGWEARAGGGDECVRPESALGSRSMSFGGSDAGVVVETVATYADAAAADAAVASLGRAAAGCGWTLERDPRLGSASVAARQDGRAMTAVSAEGVLVLLVGTGEVTRDALGWGSLVDVALGTSCPAAPDGCH